MNEKIKGFTLISSADVPDYDGKASLWRHDRTGFEVLTIKNDQREQFFSYIVYTPPCDDTGVFHIIEHTVLSGSERYPVKEAFNEAMKKGCPTFMNAMTGVDKTYYLASSAIRKDFDNIFAVYSDAVFRPLLRKQTFLQEGIRIMTDPEPHFEGVVFSEMNGVVSSHDSVASYTSTRNLFPNSPYIYESGGDPEAIATLKYQQYLDTYKKFYTPSNMSLLLFGDVDVKEKLEWLDEEYLKDRTFVAPPVREQVRPHWTEPRSIRKASMASENAEEGDSSIIVSWALGDVLDRKESMILSILVDLLLGNPGCPLYRRIVASGLGKDLSPVSGMDNSFRSLLFDVGFTGAKEEKKEEIEKFIIASLREIAEEGFAEKEIEAALRRFEFGLNEIKGGAPQGLRALFRVDGDMVYGKNPIFSLFPKADMQEVRSSLDKDPKLFEKYIMKNLVENPHRLLSVIVNDPHEAERQKESLAKILEKEMKLVDPKDEQVFNEWKNYEDTPETLSCFSALRNEDLPESFFEPTPGTPENGIVAIPCYSAGIVYYDISFDVSDFSVGELQSLTLYSRLLSMCSVGSESMAEFQTDMRFSTGGCTFSIESGTDWVEKKEKVFFMIRLKMLPGAAAESLALIEKLLKEGNFDETEVMNAIVDLSTEFQSGVIPSGNVFSFTAAAASISPALYLNEKINGVSFWLSLVEMEKNIDKTIADMKEAREKLLDGKRLLSQVLADEENLERATGSLESFTGSFEKKSGVGIVSHPIGNESEKKGLLIPGGMNYCGAAVPLKEEDGDLKVAANIFLRVLGQQGLWDRVRAKGGAYGAGTMVDMIEDYILFYSYRDPRVKGTYEDYRKTVEEDSATPEDIEQIKLSERSNDFKPLAPGQKASLWMKRRLFSITDELRIEMRKKLLAVGMEEIVKAKAMIGERMDESTRIAVLGDRKLIEESGLGLDETVLPF